MKPLVLVAIKGLGIGGAERLLVAASEMWAQSRFSFHVAYVLPWKDQLTGELRDRGVPVTCIGSRSGFAPSTPLRLRALVRKSGAALVHAHSPSIAIVARVVCRVPVVYTEHNVADSYHPVTRALNRATYGRNRGVIAVSEAVAGSLRGHRGPEPVTIPNGVALRAGADASIRCRGELGIGPETPLVVHVANIRPGKGHDALLAMAAELPGVRIVSIGTERRRGDLERLRSRARGTAVTFLGRRADAADFIAAADVFVVASTHEGLPVSLLEAMALGTPVVATAVGGVPEVVRDAETGLLVPPSDPASLSRAVAGLIEDRNLAKRLAARALELVSREYRIDEMVRATEAVYRDVLRASPTTSTT